MFWPMDKEAVLFRRKEPKDFYSSAHGTIQAEAAQEIKVLLLFFKKEDLTCLNISLDASTKARKP